MPEAAAAAVTDGGTVREPISAANMYTEKLDVEEYAARYSGRTRLVRLIFIAERCDVEAIELEALRLAHDEIKEREDPLLYREIAARINGRLGERYKYDQPWVDAVNRRIEQRKQELESDLNSFMLQTNMVKESIRMAYNNIGDFCYAHGFLSDAFESYVQARGYCNTSEHIIQMCLNVLLVSIDLGQYTHISNNISIVENLTGPLDPSIAIKLKVVAGLAYLEAREYKLAARKFAEIGPELAINYSEVIAPQDVAIYKLLCSLACYSDLEDKIFDTNDFGNSLDMVPQAKELFDNFCSGHFSLCLENLEKLEPYLLLDVHVHDHLRTLYKDIRENLASRDRISIQIDQLVEIFGSLDDIPDFDTLPGPSEIIQIGTELNSASNAAGTEIGREHAVGAAIEPEECENVAVPILNLTKLVLPNGFQGSTMLPISLRYGTCGHLSEAINGSKLRWISRQHAHALLSNGGLFEVDNMLDQIQRFDGCIAVISNNKFNDFPADDGSYTTSNIRLHEKKLKGKDDSPLETHEMKGNLWARRRTCFRNNSQFHVLQWRSTSKNKPGVQSTEELLKEILKAIKGVEASIKTLITTLTQTDKENGENAKEPDDRARTD